MSIERERDGICRFCGRLDSGRRGVHMLCSLAACTRFVALMVAAGLGLWGAFIFLGYLWERLTTGA